MLTEEQAQEYDWLERLDCLGVSEADLTAHRNQLSRQFGFTASVNDTVWRILNSLAGKYEADKSRLEQVYREMAALSSKEGKDPTVYLEQAEAIRGASTKGKKGHEANRIFLGHDELAHVRRLRAQEKFDKAEEMLMRAEPSPAVLDEIRKLASVQAKMARKEGDWEAVVKHLISYQEYADEVRDYSVTMTNQEPPEHTPSDKRLLEEAKAKLE